MFTLRSSLSESSLQSELKKVSELVKVHEAQMVNYLKATGMKVGLLINFGDALKIVRRAF